MPKKKKRGRPKGSKNKVKDTLTPKPKKELVKRQDPDLEEEVLARIENGMRTVNVHNLYNELVRVTKESGASRGDITMKFETDGELYNSNYIAYLTYTIEERFKQ